MARVRKPVPRADPSCPNVAEHTDAPTGYVAWHEWAEEMSKTHKQVRCSGCDRYSIWIPKEEHHA